MCVYLVSQFALHFTSQLSARAQVALSLALGLSLGLGSPTEVGPSVSSCLISQPLVEIPNDPSLNICCCPKQLMILLLGSICFHIYV